MQIRRIWEFLGIRMTRTLQHSKQRKGCPQPVNFKADQWTAFFRSPHLFTLVIMLALSLKGVMTVWQAQPFRGRRSVRYPVSSEYRRFLFGNSCPYQCGPAEKKSIPPP